MSQHVNTAEPVSADFTGTMGAVAVALIWGITNPLISRGAKKMNERIAKLTSNGKRKKRDNDGLIHAYGMYALAIVLSWEYYVPLALNLGGSAIFYWAISSASLSKTAPLTNSLTSVFTMVAGALWFGEKLQSRAQVAGILLVTAGSYFIMTSAAGES